MGQRVVRVALLSLSITIVVGSCIFQNDPVGPNNPPVLESYYPLWTFKSMILPDSCFFNISASDPDGDMLDYKFYLDDELISTTDSAVFYGFVEGQYTIEGRAYDSGEYVSRKWMVTVDAKPNTPPVIDWWDPEQSSVACVVGDTLDFHFSVKDDHPESLIYTYLVDGEEIFSGYPDLIHRFLENGEFTLQGTVWDGEFSDTVTWYVAVTGYPDTIPPSVIDDLVGETGDEPRTIRLGWTAPGDDGSSGTAAGYILRTSTYPIVTEDDWLAAAGKMGEPLPSPAGSPEEMIVYNLNPGTYLYATIRAADDFFNLSPIGNCVRVLVRGADVNGMVIDLWNGEGVPGILVNANGVSDTADATGHYELKNLPYFRDFRARDEMINQFIGYYYDSVVRLSGFYETITLDLYVIKDVGLHNANTPEKFGHDYLNFFKVLTKTDGWVGKPAVHKSWNHYPVTVYNPPKSYGDVDCQLTARNAMAEWEAATGLDLFIEVDEQIGSDVEIVYVDSLVAKHQVSTPAYNSDGTPAKKVVWIYSGYAGVPITVYPDLIYLHEFGHVLCLDHVEDTGYLMLGGTRPLAEYVTEDEANAVRIIYHAPPVFDYATIINN